MVCSIATYVQCQDADPVVKVLLDLDPADAAGVLAQQKTNLNFAPYEGTRPVLRTNPEDPDQVEDIYRVSQYHGQDGLGNYGYGYSNPADAKVESKQNGHVRGSYNWYGTNGKVIKVKYWDDGNGFHHEDNLPKIVLKPVEETPALRAARLAHEAAWKAAAEANQVAASQYRLVYNQQNSPNEITDQYAQYQGAATQDNAVYVNPVDPNEPRSDGLYHPELDGPEDVTGPPRGFFYSIENSAPIKYDRAEYDAKRLQPHPSDIVSLDDTPLEPLKSLVDEE